MYYISGILLVERTWQCKENIGICFFYLSLISQKNLPKIKEISWCASWEHGDITISTAAWSLFNDLLNNALFGNFNLWLYLICQTHWAEFFALPKLAVKNHTNIP